LCFAIVVRFFELDAMRVVPFLCEVRETDARGVVMLGRRAVQAA
jgi:hypothetical protein